MSLSLCGYVSVFVSQFICTVLRLLTFVIPFPPSGGAPLCGGFGQTCFLSPCADADRHAGDMPFSVSVFLCFCPQMFCDGYICRGLTQGNEIWQDGRSGWVAGVCNCFATLSVNFGPAVSPPKAKK